MEKLEKEAIEILQVLCAYDNTYNAESGINYLSVSVYYRISYLGV